MQYETPRPNLGENFDSICIQSSYTVTVLNTAADIHYLDAALKDSSLMLDDYSQLGRGTISARRWISRAPQSAAVSR